MKRYKIELPNIQTRLQELEKAAKLVDKSIYRKLILVKISTGLDELSLKEKEKSISFANTMNAIEGILISKETASNIDSWKNGNLNFSSVFHSTLTMYGFGLEVNNA